MKTYLFGQTLLKKPIIAYEWQGPKPVAHLFILGGVHGDEVEGSTACLGLLQELMQKSEFNYQLRLTLVPTLNLDGQINMTRQNARGVDLNRNLATQDWSANFENIRYYPGKSKNSEPENQALVQFIENEKPDFIITMHSWKPMLNTNGDCSVVAEAIHDVCHYEIQPDIGYPTPGSLGAYAADDRGIPTLTYEIERYMDLDQVIDVHVKALLAALKACEEKYKNSPQKP